MRTAEIAGAGLAGLALAAGLGQRGWHVIVHEAGEVLRSSGGGLYISRDGMWALDQLGQGEAFRRRSFAPTGFETWINGNLHRAHENDGVFRTALRGQLHNLLVDAARNAGVEIRTFHNATRLAGYRPATPDEFAYSIAFPVAAMIVRGQVGVPELAEETLRDPDVLRISTATQLIDDDHFTAISQGKRWAEVTLVLKDGQRHTSAPRTPRGDRDMPLSDAEISQKFHLFADPVLGRHRAEEIEDHCGAFDSLSSAGFARLLDLTLTNADEQKPAARRYARNIVAS